MLQTLNNRSLTSVRDDSLASFRTDTKYYRYRSPQDVLPTCVSPQKTDCALRGHIVILKNSFG
jgi:hypothetical protein